MIDALIWARLSFRQQRWELILVALGVAAIALVTLWFVAQIAGAREAAGTCLDPTGDLSQPPVGCNAVLNAYYATINMGTNLLLASFAAPFVIGVLLGVPLVAREIDSGTAQLAWSLGPSRSWWLLRRSAFVALFVAIALGVLAVTTETIAASMEPQRDLQSDFVWMGQRGWLLVVRGLATLTLGLLVGALIGRVLPAIIAGALVAALVFIGLGLAEGRWHASLAEPHRFGDQTVGPGPDVGALYTASGLELPDGEVATWEELAGRGIEANFMDEQGRYYASEADMAAGRILGADVLFAVPGRLYPVVTAVSGLAAVAVTLVSLLMALLVVRRRRPV